MTRPKHEPSVWEVVAAAVAPRADQRAVRVPPDPTCAGCGMVPPLALSYHPHLYCVLRDFGDDY